MSVEENILLMRRWFQEVWNEERTKTIYDLLAENATEARLRIISEWLTRLEPNVSLGFPISAFLVSLNPNSTPGTSQGVAAHWDG